MRLLSIQPYSQSVALVCCLLFIISGQLPGISKPLNQEIDSLNKLLQQPMHDTSKVLLLIEIGTRYNSVDLKKSLEYLKEAQSLARISDIPVLNARVDFTFGNFYLFKADYKSALFYYQQALKVFEAQKKYDNMLRCLNNIGVVYTYLNKIDFAEVYFKEALELSDKYGYQSKSGILYSSLAYIREQKSDFAEAIRYYEKALAIGYAEKDSYVIGLCYENIGSVQLKQNNFDKARIALTKALAIVEMQNSYQRLSSIYDLLGELESKEGNQIEAEKFLKLSGLFAEKAGMTRSILDYHKHLSELYAKKHKFKEAYAERLLYESMKDSVLNEETYKQVNDIQNAYTLEKKNNEITLLNKDKEIAEANTRQQTLLRNIFIVLTLSVFAIVIILWRNITLKQRLNKTLKIQNERLVGENAVAKYEVLKSRVDPHFLFNSLSTLSAIVQTDKHKAIEFIEHFSTLYRNILETIDVAVVNLSDELSITQNYLYLQQVRFGNKLHIQLDLTDPEKYFIPSFALQMVLENAIKHNIISSNRNLYIHINISNNALVIENNLQPRHAGKSSLGIGQQNLIERYRMFGHTLPSFQSTETHYIATIPLFNVQPQIL